MLRHLVTYTMFFISIAVYSQRVGLVLSGGGAKGLAHIGVIKVLEENNIPIDYIAGTSMGAIVAAMYASGMSPDKMVMIVTSPEFQNWANGTIDDKFRFNFMKREADASWIDLNFSLDSGFRPKVPGGYIESHSMDLAFMEYFSPPSAASGYDFNNLFVPFRCITSDVNAKEAVVMRDGDLGSAVRASMAAPFYFAPIVVKGRLMFDGGIYNNFPADVMIKDFNPDFIIGCNVSSNTMPAGEDDPLLQLENMIVSRTNYNLPPGRSVMIEPDISSIKFLDFDKAADIVDLGYQAALAGIQEISELVNTRVDVKDVEQKRKEFIARQPELLFKNVFTSGLTYTQSIYLTRNILHKKDSITIDEFTNTYYKIIADDQIESIFPHAKYNPNTGFYNLYLKVKREKRFNARIGGNISSSTLNTGFIAAEHKILRRRAVSVYANTYFGKFYSSALATLRMRYYTHIPFYNDISICLNNYDYFKSSNDWFYSETKPPYMIHQEVGGRINLVFPLRNSGKIETGITGGNIKNNYLISDTSSIFNNSDRSMFLTFSPYFRISFNNTNYIQYSTKGSKSSFTLRYTDLSEEINFPKLPFEIFFEKEHYYFIDADFKREKYFPVSSVFTAGYFIHAHWSNRPCYLTYFSTLLNLPAYEPFPIASTMMLSEMRSPEFAGGGLIFIINLAQRFHLRTEGHFFHPFRNLMKAGTYDAFYNNKLDKYNILGQTALVYQAPFGPVSLSLCYFSNHKPDLYMMFNIGYLLFNRKLLDY